MLSRAYRNFVANAFAFLFGLTLLPLVGGQATSPDPFDYADVKGIAEAASLRTYVEREPIGIKEIQALDYDRYQHIDFLDERALWAGSKSKFRIQFFHLGLYFQKPVRMNEIVEGTVHPIEFDPSLFYYGKSGVEGDALPHDLGYAGFRINFEKDWDRDVAAFLGASYFRAVGFDWQYGLSARGLGIDTGMPTGEEFPDFVEYWLEKPEGESDTLVVYALLDTPSTTGAYRFVITPGETLLMEVEATLYPRKSITDVGIAPLTSMFQFAENDRRDGVSDDWRPEIHDSDGLWIWNGYGEWLWRPLVNPAHPRLNAFLDKGPKGFGLIQRDRNFDHYQDDGVFYDKRPSLWVEPSRGWGAGSVKLFELPTVDETFDNIVAFWQPEAPLEPGEEYRFSYRLFWGVDVPVKSGLATVIATRTGKGGNIGQEQAYYSRRFVLDFEGEVFEELAGDAVITPEISTSHGSVENAHARWMPDRKGVRAMFDLVPDDSHEPINVRLYLKSDDRTLSETWLYQFTPDGVR